MKFIVEINKRMRIVSMGIDSLFLEQLNGEPEKKNCWKNSVLVDLVRIIEMELLERINNSYFSRFPLIVT